MSSDHVVTVNGKSVDLSVCLPLKLRDWEVLETQGLTPQRLGSPTLTDVAKYLIYVMHKGNPAVTEDDVRDLTPEGAGEIMKTINKFQSPAQPPVS